MKSYKYLQIIFVVAAFVIMVVVGVLYIRNIVYEQIVLTNTEVMNSATSTVRSMLSETEISLINIAFLVEDMIADNRGNESLLTLFRNLTNWYRRTSQNYLAFNGVYGYINGSFIDGTGWVPPDDYLPRTRPWYVGAMISNGRVYFTDPYTDAETNTTVISVSRQIFAPDGTSAGVIAIDFDISAFAAYINNLRIAKSGYGILLNNRMEIISHRNQQLVGESIAVSTSGYFPIFEALLESNEIIAKQIKDHDGVPSILFMAQLFNGWHVGTITPRDVYLSPVRTMALVLSLLGTALVFVLSIILLKLNSAREKADERSRSKSSFLARMSHEIRTPMNAIVGMSELILREGDKIPQKTYAHALAIKQASANLLSIINDILDFSKIESGKFEIMPENYLFSSLINDVINIIRLRLQDKPVYFSVNIQSSIPNNLIGDGVRIRQMLINLLSNAVKFTAEGYVSLKVKGEVKDRSVKFTFIVKDTGMGIEKENLDKLFSDFVQVNKRTDIEGTGLGLVITRNLAEAMGGSIAADSVYGEGSTFTLVLPQEIASPEPFAAVEDPKCGEVLLFEPHTVYAQSISETVNDLGLICTSVPNIDIFENELKSRDFCYAFVASSVYKEVRALMDKLTGCSTKIAVITELSDHVGLANVRSLMTPAHAMSVANVLNNVPDTIIYNLETVRYRFPKARILVVDDIATNLSVVEGLLLPFDMRMDFSLSGEGAVEMVEKNNYDLVFMDHMMPGMDGIEATKLIRQLDGKRFKDLPIIALTANAVSGMKEMFLQNGMNDFLPKPIDPSKINAMLLKWIPKDKHEKLEEERQNEEGLSIPGLDVSKGIAFTGGTEDVYIRILSKFHPDAFKRIGLIRDALEKDDIKNYTIYVHALKSSLATIGSESLAVMAAALERAGLENNRSYIDHNNEGFINMLEKLLNDIEPYITA